MTSLSSNLLTCPFCGKQPTSQWYGAGPAGDDGYWGIDCCNAFAHADSEADAAAQWNRRSADETKSLQGPYCPDTNQPCDRMCQSICNRRECEHEFVAAGPLSETDPRCIKCHRRWSSVNGSLPHQEKK